MDTSRFRPAWLEPYVGYVTHWILRGRSREEIREMGRIARGYPDITDAEFEAVYERAVADARATTKAQACRPGTLITECY